MLVLAVIVAQEAPLVVALAVVALDGLAGTPYFPAVGAMTPELVSEDDLAAANALTGVVDNLTITIGPALGALLLLAGSPGAAIALNAVTFLVSASLAWRIDVRSAGDPNAAVESVRQQVTAGVKVLTGSPDLMLLTLISLAFTVTFGMEIVLFPLIATDLLGLGQDGLGWLLAASGLGGVLGTWVAGRLAERPATARILVASSMLTGLPLLILIVIDQPAIAFIVLLAEGIGFVVSDVISTTTIQRVAPRDVLGRLFGLFATLFVLGILVGNVLAGVLVTLIGLQGTMAVASGILILTAIVCLPRSAALDQIATQRVEAVADRVDLLVRLRIFDGASRAILESAAASSSDTHATAGTVVVREGEAADAFYVIRDGTFLVTPVGRELGPNDYFGEIGILEGVPRTATVTATTDADLCRIDADAFLAALNEAPLGARRLSDTVAGRLAASRPDHHPRFTGPDTPP
jgi:predicted MFS family arabinose efflux permease